MRKSSCFLITFLFLMGLTSPLFSQAPDTLWVEVDQYDENYELTEIIEGDTTATGERNNPTRVYGLRNGGWYYLSGRIRNIGYHLSIIGEPRSDTIHPPVVLMDVDNAGTSDDPMIEASGNITVKNIYFLCTDALGVDTKMVIVGNIENLTFWIDRCIFEYGHRSIYTQKPGLSIFATNNLVRNLMQIGPKNTNYRFWIQTKKVSSDTIWIENNTFLNCPGAPLAVSNTVDGQQTSFRFVHNTIVNSSCQTFHFPYWGNAVFKNNIWYSALSMGDAVEQRVKQLADAHIPFSIIQIDTIGNDAIMPEADRMIDISHNAWFVPDDILTMQADSSHKTSPISFITEREEGMFADKQTWPGLSFDEATLYYQNPNFVNEPDKRAEFVEFNAHFLEKPFPTVDLIFDWDWHGADVEPFQFDWPLTEDLSYTNATLLTAGDDGLPLGDLNWFPGITAVEDGEEALAVRSFELDRNYPNPFNPTTYIRYRLATATDVKLRVYDLLGKEVKTLVNIKQTAGSHTVQWDGTNNEGVKVASGIYLYKMESSDYSHTQKMMLLK